MTDLTELSKSDTRHGMTQNPQTFKEPRANISLTGKKAKLLRELHTKLQDRHTPLNVSITDVVSIALDLLNADLNKK